MVFVGIRAGTDVGADADSHTKDNVGKVDVVCVRLCVYVCGYT